LLATPGAYPRRQHLKGAPIGLALALLSNSKTYWKGFPRKNTLAYEASSSVMKEKKFYNIDTRMTFPSEKVSPSSGEESPSSSDIG
jgi:hypothetical protein